MQRIILVCDGQQAFSGYLRAAIADTGFSVEICRLPEDLMARLSLVKNPRPAAILIGTHMACGSLFTGDETENGARTGYLLHKRIRSMYPDIPIIFVPPGPDTEAERIASEDKYTLHWPKTASTPSEMAENLSRLAG